MREKRMDLNEVHFNLAFLTESVAEITDLLQLKVLLFAIWLVQQSGDDANALRLADFFTYPEFTDTLGDTTAAARENLLKGIEANLASEFITGNNMDAIRRGGPFYLRTARGSQAAQLLAEQKESTAHASGDHSAGPNLYRLYEENIAPITPLMADELKEAEKEYPFEWLEEAIQIAVVNNVRRWRYIQAILKSWKEEGRNGRDQRNAEADYKQYTQGKYGKFIRN